MFHRFGWSGRPGIDICACGIERVLTDLVTGEEVWIYIVPGLYVGRNAPACARKKAA